MATFSAGPQALGYLYQARVALATLLKASDDTLLRIEALDDIELSGQGSGELALKQLKHHVEATDLSDYSVDLWKSIRVWAEQVKGKKFALRTSKLFLFTTATAPAGSVAEKLGTADRKVAEALVQLQGAADKSKNATLKSSFAAFNALTDDEKLALLNSMTIQTSSGNIAGIKDDIKRSIRPAVHAEFVEPLYQRIEGWWFDSVVLHLLKPVQYPHLSQFDLMERIASLAEGFRDDSLPIDFLNEDPDDGFVAGSKSKMFVRQIEAVGIRGRPIVKAIFDYYKAFHQRARWIDEGLLGAGEVELFEKRLLDEWERYLDSVCSDPTSLTSKELEEIGRRVLRWAELEANHLRIRPRVDADFVRRGTFHMLADREPVPSLHWNPSFLDSLSTVVGTPMAPK